MQQRHNAESFLGFSSNEEEIRKCIQDKLYRLFYGFYKPSVKHKNMKKKLQAGKPSQHQQDFSRH